MSRVVPRYNSRIKLLNIYPQGVTCRSPTSKKLTSWPLVMRLKLEMPIMTSFWGATLLSNSSSGLTGLPRNSCVQAFRSL